MNNTKIIIKEIKALLDKLKNDTLGNCNLLYQYYIEKEDIYKIENANIFSMVKLLSKNTNINYNNIDVSDTTLLKTTKTVISDVAILDNNLTTEKIDNFLNCVIINTFDDLIQIVGILTNRWQFDLTELISKYKINEIVFCRDVIYLYLVNCGISENEAIEIMEFIRKGKAKKDIYKMQWTVYKEKIIKTGANEKYINLLENTLYLSSSISVFNYTKIILWLSYYKLYYNDDYSNVLLQMKA